jgi:hypothetical protein
MMKFKEKPEANADIVDAIKPSNRSDLCSNFMLKAPNSSDAIIATIKDKVLICPAIPTDTPKVNPISIRRRLVMMLADVTEKLEANKVGNKKRLFNIFVSTSISLFNVFHPLS